MVRRHLDQQSLLLEIGHDVLAAREAILSRVRAGLLVHRRLVGHHVGRLQAMSQADLVIGGIVGRRDFDRAGTEGRVHRLVGDDGDAPADGGQHHRLADQMPPALILRVHGDGGIAQDRLRAGGRHLDERGRALGPRAAAPFTLRTVPIFIQDGITDVPEMALPLVGNHLQVRDGRLATRAPVDQVRAPVDQALFVETHESSAHRVAQVLVQREALPRPIARDAQPLVLLGDAVQRFPRPCPAPLDELLPAQVVAGQPFLAQLPLHHVLGGDTGVVSAGQVERLLAPHTIVARHPILDGHRHRVAQVQDAGHVGRRHRDTPRGAVRFDQAQLDLFLGPEVALRLPPLIKAFLVFLGIVSFR